MVFAPLSEAVPSPGVQHSPFSLANVSAAGLQWGWNQGYREGAESPQCVLLKFWVDVPAQDGRKFQNRAKCGPLVVVTLLHYCFKLKSANHCTARWSKFRQNCTHSKVRKRKIINYIVLLPPQNDLFFLCLSIKV